MTRVAWGVGAAFFAAVVALDATMGNPTKYPFLHTVFGPNWDEARNVAFAIASVGAAVCGFMAATAKP